MKRLAFLVLFIIPLALALAVPGPTTAGTDQFVGSWHYTGQGEGHQNTLTFKSDGRFSITTRLSNGGVIHISGRWVYNDGKLHYTYERSSLPISELAPGKTGVDIVESVSDRTLVVLQGVKREPAIFHRLKE